MRPDHNGKINLNILYSIKLGCAYFFIMFSSQLPSELFIFLVFLSAPLYVPPSGTYETNVAKALNQILLLGMKDHERPIFNFLPRTLLVFILVIWIVFWTGHGVPTVLAVAAAAAVYTTSPPSGNGGTPR